MNAIEMSKAIFTLMRTILEKWIAGCVDCKGEDKAAFERCGTCNNMVLRTEYYRHPIGMPHDHCGNPTIISEYLPCPTCAPWRAMLEKVHWCEVKPFKVVTDNICMHCGRRSPNVNFSNPDLTTHMTGSRLTLVDMLDRMGEWPGFLWWLEQAALNDKFPTAKVIARKCYTLQHTAPILTDGKYLVPAVKSYLEVV